MAELKNDFSWSKSRDATFRECPRRYFFQYYGSWGGWYNDAEPRTRKLYVLKQLKSRAMWAGEKVHDCIRKSLQNLRRGIEPMSGDEAIEATLAVMREDFANSRRGDYWKDPKTCGLFEHEYKQKVSDAKWKEIADHVANCLRTFYASDLYSRMRDLPIAQWLDVEDFASFDLDGTKVHVVLDFSFRDGERVAIYDWKTGKAGTEHNEVQLACYSLYATQTWHVAPAQVSTSEFNLRSGKLNEYHLGGIDLDSIRTYIRGSIRDMKFLLEDPDANAAREERFVFAENQGVCRFCNFRAACPRFGPVRNGESSEGF